MNTLVSFELSKLLKEKGWDKNTYSNCWVKTLDGDIIHNKDRKDIPDHDRCTQYLMQPIIAEVVMWLYEEYGIWIDVSLNQFSKPKDLQWMYSIVFTEDCTYYHSSKSYNSPTEAYQEAIKYTLKNLI